MADQANHSSASPAAKLSLVQTISSPITSGSPAWSLSFTPDAKYLAVCYGCPNTCVKIWRRVTRQCTSNKDPIDPTTDANETFKIGNSGSNMKECWRPFATIEGHTRSIRDVEFAPISTSSTLILATASFDGMVMIWEGDVSQFDDMYDSTYNSDMGSDDDENKFEECTFEAIAQLEGHENEVKHVAWNQTGSLLASCGRDKTVWVWECFLPGTVGGMASNDASMQDDGDFECLAVLQGHDGDVKSIAFAPSHGQWGEGEEILISASYDNSIKIWAEESGDWYCAATLGSNSTISKSVEGVTNNATIDNRGAVHTSTVWCLAINPGGVRFLSGSEDGSIAIWKMYTASERKQLKREQYVSTDGLWSCVGVLPDAHEGYAVLSVDCAPSRVGHGRIVSGGGDDSIRIYREIDGTSDAPKFDVDAVVHEAHVGDVNCVRWHPRDGGYLVSCGDDGAVRVWSYVHG